MYARIKGRKLAGKILTQILMWPEKYDQATYGSDNFYDTRVKDMRCDTAACVAGWAVRLGKVKNKTEDISIVAQELLQLTDEEAEWLFSAQRTENRMPKILKHYIKTAEIKYELDVQN